MQESHSDVIELTTDDSETRNLIGAQAIGCCAPMPCLRFAMEEAERLASVLKALSHPVRLQIVSLLSRFGGEVCVCDIESQFALKQPTISHHLKILRKAGLIDCEQRGLWIYYHTQPAMLFQLNQLMSELSKE